MGWPGLHTTHFPVLCCKGQHELRGIQYGGAAALHHVAARHAGGSGYTRPELSHKTRSSSADVNNMISPLPGPLAPIQNQ